LSIHASIAMI